MYQLVSVAKSPLINHGLFAWSLNLASYLKLIYTYDGKSIHVFTFISFQEPLRFLFSKIDFRKKSQTKISWLITTLYIHFIYNLEFYKIRNCFKSSPRNRKTKLKLLSALFTRGVNLRCFDKCMIAISISTYL